MSQVTAQLLTRLRTERELPEQLAHLVTDSWDWKAELTSEVLRFKQAVVRSQDG